MRATVTVARRGHDGRRPGALDDDMVADATIADVTIAAPNSTPIGDLLREVIRTVPDIANPATPVSGLLVDGDRVDPATPVAASPLRDGTVLLMDDAAATHEVAPTSPPHLPTDWQLRVVAGPSAGVAHRLTVGTTTVGRATDCGICLDDPDVSRRHALLRVNVTNVVVADSGSTNGSDVEGVPVTAQPMPLSPGSRLRLGESTLVLTLPDEAPAAVVRDPDGTLHLNRPPRLDAPAPEAQRVVVEFPKAPTDTAPARLPLVATLAPLAAGIVLAALMRRLDFLLFTVISPLMMAGQWLADRIGNRRARREERARYEAAVAQSAARLAVCLAEEERGRRHCFPNPAAIAHIARTPTVRLWERRRRDGDFLHLRLGCGTLPANLQITGAAQPQPVAHDVPLTVDLRQVGVLGLAGPPSRTAALARSLVGQLATLHSPRDLAVVLLAAENRADSWAWIRWLPHLRPTTTTAQALVGFDSDSVAARVGELAALIGARSHDDSAASRQIVVVIDGAQALRHVAGLADVLSNGPDVGVRAICLDVAESCLPAECGAVATFCDDVATRVRLRIVGKPGHVDVVADTVSAGWAECLARALAPLRDASADAGELPIEARWLELANLAAAAEQGRLAASVAERWSSRNEAGTTALLGVGIDGTFSVDLARDGPHTLIAGTTGSGKSELLQALVAALAVGNRPDALAFVLVDYKGGAAFGPCASLPHTVGIVTDLDGALVERALVSLRAELKRREALLAEVGAAGIDAYRQAGRQLARLVIVVDEFASLAEELPDFITGLVDIAQRGRSLGVHLVLATQRPEGVVSADIRANANLRICLAVTRDAESRDVIDTPDAARISRSTPGRGYARTGHGELHAFQTGRVATAAKVAATGISVRRSPFRSLARPPATTEPTATEAAGPTDLDLLVAACRKAADRLGLAPTDSPWLPTLPPVVVAGDHPDEPLTATLGIADLPARQARQPWCVDLSATTHLLVVGSPRSGRTTCLRSLAGLLAASSTSADLHLYGLDCAGGSLGALASLPQCGAVVSGHEVDRTRRLMSLLGAEVAERRQRLATGGFGSISEQRAAAAKDSLVTPLPHIVVLVDGWEAFVENFGEVDGGAPVDTMATLLRDGGGVGVHVVASCDRAGLVGRLASAVDTKLVLRLADRGDFGLVGVSGRGLPADLPAGRGFRTPELIETQVCLLDADPSGAAQQKALTAIAAKARDRDAARPPALRPRRVDALPTRVALSELIGMAGSQPLVTGSARVVLGLGGDELVPISLDLLHNGPGFLIAGPPRSGRSTALATIGSQLRTDGWHVLAVSTRASPAVAFANAAFDADDPAFEAAVEQTGRLAVLVDDAELVADSVAGPVLDRLARDAHDAGRLLIVAGTTEELAVGFRGFAASVRKSRAGLLLSPRGPYDGEVLGIRLPSGVAGPAGASPAAGRGLVVVGGTATPLQVATP